MSKQNYMARIKICEDCGKDYRSSQSPKCPHKRVVDLMSKQKDRPGREEIHELANVLEEPRAVRLLAEWLAIDHNETRLQYEKYMNDAQELYEYITVIIKYLPELKGLDRPDREGNDGSDD